MLSHEQVVARIGRHLIDAADKGLTCRANKGKGLECHADADFTRGWNPSDPLNPDNILSRTGFVMLHAGMSIF